REANRSWRVLVVDDGLDNRVLAAHILGRVGHEVEQAVDGRDALEKLRRHGFDIVLMDVQMPEMDGIVATRLIRAGSLGAEVARVPILGVSAGALQEEMERGLAAGMDEFLTKPYRARVLLEAVERLAGRVGEPEA
ncbi:MAG: response regulator, partial [Magnetococcales bacterium]|nr:response regulator [Magnetococcales bacterium]